MVEMLTRITGILDSWIYSNVLVWVLLGAGVFLTIRMNFVQVRLFGEGIRVLKEENSGDGLSSFQALMVATASRVGTGNIAGVATAIVLAGPGAVFWMWVTALIGSSSAFVESTLAQMYKKKSGDGFVGGPAYYLEGAFGKRYLGVIFACILVVTFAFGFNGLQAYNIVSTFTYYGNTSGLLCGVVLSLFAGYFFFKGSQSIGKVSAVLVPCMAVLYLLIGVCITIANLSYVPGIVAAIFKEAMDVKSMFVGFASSCMVVGIKKGLFSNEAGMGSAPNAAASANVSHPVKQGLVQVISVFIDTFVICTTTVMIVLCTQHLEVVQGLDAIPLVQAAVFSLFGEFGVGLFSFAVILFAFTSLIGNYFYAEANIRFMSEDRVVLFAFRLFCVVSVFIGANSNLLLAWQVADLCMACMAFMNVVAICLLSGDVKVVLEDYVCQLKAGVEPVYEAWKEKA